MKSVKKKSKGSLKCGVLRKKRKVSGKVGPEIVGGVSKGVSYTLRDTGKILCVSVQTLRNWDKLGLLKSGRTMGNHRRYSGCNLIKYMKKMGLGC